MTIEIVDFPINSMVMFHSYVNVYQRVEDFSIPKKQYFNRWFPVGIWAKTHGATSHLFLEPWTDHGSRLDIMMDSAWQNSVYVCENDHRSWDEMDLTNSKIPLNPNV